MYEELLLYPVLLVRAVTSVSSVADALVVAGVLGVLGYAAFLMGGWAPASTKAAVAARAWVILVFVALGAWLLGGAAGLSSLHAKFAVASAVAGIPWLLLSMYLVRAIEYVEERLVSLSREGCELLHTVIAGTAGFLVILFLVANGAYCIVGLIILSSVVGTLIILALGEETR